MRSIAASLCTSVCLLCLAPEAALAQFGPRIGDDGYVRPPSEAERIEREFNSNRSAAQEEWRQAHPPEGSEGPGILADRCERREYHIREMDRLIFEADGLLPQQTVDNMRALVALERTEERSQPCPVVGPPLPMSRTAVMRDNSRRDPQRTPTPPPAGLEISGMNTQVGRYDMGPWVFGGFCPSDSSPPPPTPLPPPSTSTPPTSSRPPQGLTQEEVDAVARQQSVFDSAAREQREERERRAARKCGSIQISAGVGEAEIPRANFGTVRDGPAGASPERPAAFTERRIPMLTVEAGGAFQGIGRFKLGYREGDARTRTDVPASTTGGAAGTTFTDNAPSGSTGAIGSTVVLGVDTEARVQGYSIEYDIGPALGGFFLGAPTIDELRSKAVVFQPNFGLQGDFMDVIFEGDLAITVPVQLAQSVRQRLGQIELGVFGGGEALIPLGEGARFTLGAQGGVYYYDYDLETRETVTANFGPAADRAFTNELEDSKSGVAYRGDASAELEVDLDPSLALFMSGEVSYFSVRGQAVNPSSGDFVLGGGTSFLDTEDVVDWSILAGVRARWGGAR